MSPLRSTHMDVLIDLTADWTDRGIEPVWPHPDRFTARARKVTCVVRADESPTLLKAAMSFGWTVVPADSAIRACTEAMSRAAVDDAFLLVLRGRVDASDEAVFVMRRSLERDPMFGCAAARIRCEAGCCFKRPSRNGLITGSWIPRRTLGEVPEIEISPELFESSLLLAPQIVAEFGPLDTRFSGMPAAMLEYLSRARRCGFRTVIANRAVMRICGLSCRGSRSDDPAVPQHDRTLLHRETPELDRGWEEFRAASCERFERLSAHTNRRGTETGRQSLLLDIRNVTTVHNGTSQAVLGCVDALHRLGPSWDVTVVAQPAAIAFHGLRRSWPGWDLTTSVSDRLHTAALRLSQPWHIREMVDLHHAALFNVYFMLDTISWDIIHESSQRIDGTWSFLADHADGLLFDSVFTQRRFLTRFNLASNVPHAVCYYPFAPQDYRDVRAEGTPESDYILVVGNDLHHKDAIRTIELISNAFPFRPVVSLGPRLSQSPYLRAYQSGTLSDFEVTRLYAAAKVVIFPSFYEGFGFPVVTALAYGKTLIARKSELLDEIAARCATGRLIAFTHREQVVEILGRLLHGGDVQDEPLGAAMTGVTRRWSDVASDIMAFMEGVTGQPARSRWLRREHAINQLLAFRG